MSYTPKQPKMSSSNDKVAGYIGSAASHSTKTPVSASRQTSSSLSTPPPPKTSSSVVRSPNPVPARYHDKPKVYPAHSEEARRFPPPHSGTSAPANDSAANMGRYRAAPSSSEALLASTGLGARLKSSSSPPKPHKSSTTKSPPTSPGLKAKRAPHSAPLTKAVAKMWLGSGGKASNKVTTEDVSEPHLQEDREAKVRSRSENTFYPHIPLGTSGEGSESSSYSTPSLDFQRTFASNSSPGTSFIDMSDDGRRRNRHQPSRSVDHGLSKSWKSRLMGNHSKNKSVDSGTNTQGNLQRSISLRTKGTKGDGRASPRPSLNHSHGAQPSFDLKPPPNLALDNHPSATRSAYGLLPSDPFSRPPLPHAYTEPALSLDELSKVDATYTQFPEGYEERMKAAPRPKGRPGPVSPPTVPVKESGSPPIPLNVQYRLATEPGILDLQQLEKMVKESGEQNLRESEKEKAKSSEEAEKKREGHQYDPEVLRKLEKGERRQHSDAPKNKTLSSSTSRGPAIPDPKVSALSKAIRSRPNVPSALPPHNTFPDSDSPVHTTSASSSRKKTVDKEDPCFLPPFTPIPPLTPTHSSGDEMMDGEMCLTMSDFDFESDVEKPKKEKPKVEKPKLEKSEKRKSEMEEPPPPLPPKDRTQLVKSKKSSSKSAVKTPKPIRRPPSLETTLSVYSQASFDGDIDLVITPRPTGRMY
ncbi:hypothetical protein NMY22_g6172 [Coprinellus aureogranulatus]|nr:hypothetical protein NMY22_g6172 [Coprinellus aureogranulatus]